MKIRKHISNSKKWFMKQLCDPYVQQAHKMKIRSRAWFKLSEIDCSDCLFVPGMTVLDLGASPGGWSQYVSKKIGHKGYIIACDILPMDAIVGVKFLQGNLGDSSVIDTLIHWVHGRTVHVVLSDMSPNISGISDVDMSKFVYLAQLSLNVCRLFLVCGGTFLVKIFQGCDFDKYLYDVRSVFDIVKIRKPNASRVRSREVYIVAKGYKI